MARLKVAPADGDETYHEWRTKSDHHLVRRTLFGLIRTTNTEQTRAIVVPRRCNDVLFAPLGKRCGGDCGGHQAGVKLCFMSVVELMRQI